MREGLTRAEIIILLLVLLLVASPLIKEGGLSGLLFDGVGESSLDPGILSSVRLGMVLLTIVAIVSVIARSKGGQR